MHRDCKVHGYTKHFQRKERGAAFRCNKCASDAVVLSRVRKKIRLVEAFGGVCQLCGYNKCRWAFDFHHKDAKTKSFGLGSRMDLAYETLYEEALKCILLCANCHREVHSELIY